MAEFPGDGLTLEDLARRECRPAWDAWVETKKEPVAGRSSLQIAGSGRADVVVGWLEPRDSEGPSKILDQARQTLYGAVLDVIKSGRFIFKGIHRGGHQPIDIWPPLLGKARIISLKRSILMTDGLRFEHVYAFPSAVQSVATESIESAVVPLPIGTPTPAGNLAALASRSSARAEAECRRWLYELARDNPVKNPAGTRDDCQNAAMHKFPGLSKRGFGRAWDAIIGDFPGIEWHLQRRPEKSPHQNHRTN